MNVIKNVSDYFEEQVQRKASAIAIEDEHNALSYDDLNERSNNIGLHLINEGVCSGDRVILCLNRSINTVAAMIAINKIGACYVSVDPEYPDSVLEYQTELSQPRLAIISTVRNWVMPKGTNQVVDIDDLVRPIDNSDNGSAIPKAPKSKDTPIYIMYTSGSTGDPKGVIIPERAVIRLAINPDFIDIKNSDTFLLHSPLTFDASTFEIWTPLLNGARLVVYETEGFDPNKIAKQVKDQRVTVLWLTAAIFHFSASYTIELFENLRVLLAGGDVLKSTMINRVLDYYPWIIVINGYGPTENTTFTSCHIMTEYNRPYDTVPIGQPISGTETRILDDKGREVENGSPGELVVSGDGVAIGYLNPGENNSAFFEDENGNLCYRTGDTVRRNNVDEIEFIGRNDRLVKIRGYRVSLDEVSAAINKLENIDECVTDIVMDAYDRKNLIALVQSRHLEGLSKITLKKQIEKILPSYMVPDKIYLYSEIPITKNGKIDRSCTQAP